MRLFEGHSDEVKREYIRQERDLQEGNIPYVTTPTGRMAITESTQKKLGLKQGESVGYGVIVMILEDQVAEVTRKIEVEQIANATPNDFASKEGE